MLRIRMKSKISISQLTCLLLCLGHISIVSGYPMGANIPASACVSMTPNHGFPPQTGNPPYTISLSSTTYQGGSTITVTLGGTQTFKGFMVQARRASGQSTDPVGSFTPIAGSTASPCSGVITHSARTEKSSMALTWTAPGVPVGDLVFMATFVQQRDTFWVQLPSDTVQSPESLEADSECGTSLGCFTQCTGGSCDFTISWNVDGNFGVYNLATVTSETNPWMAIGFSYDSKMGNDSVSGCLTPQNGQVSILNAVTTGRILPSVIQDPDVTLTSSSLSNGIFRCTIRRLIAGNGQRFDISQEYTLLFARGRTENSVIQYHNMANRFISNDQHSVSATSNELSSVPTTPSTAPNPTPPPPAAGTIDLPSDCGTSRGCYSMCSGTQCTFIVSWIESGNNGVYTLTLATSESTPWMALGLSSDRTMGSDSVIGCYADSSGNVGLFNGENTGRSEPQRYTDNEVMLVDSIFNDGIISCTFSRPQAANANGKRFDINQRWYHLFATGSASGSGQSLSLSYHGTNRFPSNGQYSVSDTPNEGASFEDFPLVKWHGSLMITAWIFFASIGIVVARYYKPVWTVEMFSQKVWFQVHRTCMVFVLLTTVAGFIIIFVEVEDLSDLEESESDRYLRAHPIMGIVVTGLTILNPLMALFRPHPGTEYRPIFNWAHWFVGTSAHILGVITIFFGVQLTKADGPEYLVYILAGYVGWQVLIELILEILQYCGRQADKSDAYNLDNLNAPKTTFVESEKTLLTKRIILILHIFVVGAVSATIIGILAVGERELED